jgi:hypothetical protein
VRDRGPRRGPWEAADPSPRSWSAVRADVIVVTVQSIRTRIVVQESRDLDSDAETPAERLRVAFELVDVAERMLRQRVRRESPSISEDDLEARVRAWYEQRPGAEFGDGEGTPVAWPRR